MKTPWVIKAGGELLADPFIRKKLLRDLAKIGKKNPLVFIHGGGPQIEKELVKNKIAVKFVNGRRVTTPEAMVLIENVLSGQINKGFTAELNNKGVLAAGLSCRDGNLIKAQLIPNLGRAAKPVKIDVRLLKKLVSAGVVPVVSSVGSDRKGGAVNINADDAASALAVGLKARHLVFLTNITGVKDAKMKTIPILKLNAIQKLIDTEVIKGGMIPKVQSAKKAVLAGVGEVNILNGLYGVSLARGTAIKR